jgi:hypothetical protein
MALVRGEGWWLPSPVAAEITQRTQDPRVPHAAAGFYEPTVLDERQRVSGEHGVSAGHGSSGESASTASPLGSAKLRHFGRHVGTKALATAAEPTAG